MTKAARYSHDKLLHAAISVSHFTIPLPSSLRQCLPPRTTALTTRNLPRDQAQPVQQQRRQRCLQGLKDGRSTQSRSLHVTRALNFNATESQHRKEQTPGVVSETSASQADTDTPRQVRIRKYSAHDRGKPGTERRATWGKPAQSLVGKLAAPKPKPRDSQAETPVQLRIRKFMARGYREAGTDSQAGPGIPRQDLVDKHATNDSRKLATPLQTKWGIPGQPRIRRHAVIDHGTRNIANGVKYVFRTIPRDVMDELPNIAYYRSKRREQEIAERFLGVKRLTTHDVVDRAILDANVKQLKKREAAFEAKVIHQKNKGNPFGKLLQNTKAVEHRHNEVEQPGEEEVLATQSTLSKQFDILSDIGSQLQFPRTEDSTLESDETLGSDQPAADPLEAKVEVHEPIDIDWDNLPLSPLMHERLIKARIRFREAKLSPQDASAYDKEKGLELENDYLAMMLASPVRTCRLTFGRLPREFLLETRTRQHPETEQIWELPHGLDPQGITANSPLGTPIPDATDVRVSLHGSDSMGEAQMAPQNTNYVTLSNNASSYMLFTWFAVQKLSSLTSTRYKRTIPQRWRINLGQRLASNIHWRQDMPGFIHSLLQRQIIDILRPLNPLLGGGIVQACSTMNESGKREIKPLRRFKGCAILYFGEHSNSATPRTSFSSIVDDIATTQAGKVEVLDDLFKATQSSQGYSAFVRLRKENGENLLVFDMTRLLTPEFVQAFAQAGYNQPVYHVVNVPGAKFLHKRLWTLTHYVMLSGAA